MSVKLEPAELATVAREHGPEAFVLTTGPDGRPRVLHVPVTVVDGVISAVVGRSAARNATDRPLVSVLWPAPTPGEMSLIADGEAEVGEEGDDGTPISIGVTGAVRHRPAS